MCINKEIKYLNGKLSEVSYDLERFKLFIGEDKFLFGICSPKGKETPLSKLMQFKTIYDTLMDLDWKIKLSFKKGIAYAYSKEVQENFDLLHVTSEEEKLAYYYIENALFRTSSLWDMLAQLYCLFYSAKIPKTKIHYKNIFNPKSEENSKFNNNDSFNSKAIEIYNYIKEKDNTNIDGQWKGNHKFTNAYRNQMTHRNSPNIASMSDYDLNLKNHPSFILKRSIEDYTVVSNYIKEILDEIENDMIKNF